MKNLFLLFIFFAFSPILFSQTWTEQYSGVTTGLYSISAVDDDIAWTCGPGGIVLKTTNKGVNWINVRSDIPSNYQLINIFALDVNTALVTGLVNITTNSIFRTSNGGLNWSIVNTHTGFGDILWMTSPSNAYFIGDVLSTNWDLLKSTNGGLNWSEWSVLPGSSGAGSYGNAGWFQDQQVWFGTIPTYKIMYSSNMGVNWTAQTVPLFGINTICFSSSTKGMAGDCTSSNLIRTTNAGNNWLSVAGPPSGSNIAGICTMNSKWWVSPGSTSGAKTVYVSTNDGASWLLDYTAPDGINRHMTKSRSGTTIWVVRVNGGISRYGAPIIGINSNTKELPSSFSLKQNYPNPFNPITKIDYDIPKHSFVNLKIFTVLGKEIRKLFGEYKSPGTYSVNFDASDLPGGIYFYRLETEGFVEIKKMIFIK